VDMSSFYLDILKDRLYTFRADSNERRAAQWVLYQIVCDMTRLIAPILSFTTEEIWKYIPKNRGAETVTRANEAESIFLAGFPVGDDRYIDIALETRWARLIAIRDEANKASRSKEEINFWVMRLKQNFLYICPKRIFHSFRSMKLFCLLFS